MEPAFDDPAISPNLRRLERLSHLVKLARENRLEELFTRLPQDDWNPYPEFVPERMVLAQGLWQHRQRDIFDLAEQSLALFGMRAERVRGPGYVWTAEAYQLTWEMDVARAWQERRNWMQERPPGAPELNVREFADLDEFLRYLVPHLAMLPPWPVRTDSGLDFVPHVIGADRWAEVEAQAADEFKFFGERQAAPAVTNCCLWQLVKPDAGGVFYDLPQSIDRERLAVQAHTAVLDALAVTQPVTEGAAEELPPF